MGHKPQRYKLKELSHLLQLEPSAILALHRGTLSPKSAKKLTLLPPQDQCELTHLINAYRLGGSKQQKLVEMVTELALRDGRAVSEIVKKWLPNQEMTSENRPQQVLGLLQSLQGQCYPNKTAAEKSFKSLVQELQPSGELTIEHSLSFEDETIEIRLRFPDPEKLKEKWEDIKRILQ
jgi:ParB family chromosome partitioning protein